MPTSGKLFHLMTPLGSYFLYNLLISGLDLDHHTQLKLTLLMGRHNKSEYVYHFLE